MPAQIGHASVSARAGQIDDVSTRTLALARIARAQAATDRGGGRRPRGTRIHRALAGRQGPGLRAVRSRHGRGGSRRCRRRLGARRSVCRRLGSRPDSRRDRLARVIGGRDPASPGCGAGDRGERGALEPADLDRQDAGQRGGRRWCGPLDRRSPGGRAGTRGRVRSRSEHGRNLPCSGRDRRRAGRRALDRRSAFGRKAGRRRRGSRVRALPYRAQSAATGQSPGGRARAGRGASHRPADRQRPLSYRRAFRTSPQELTERLYDCNSNLFSCGSSLKNTCQHPSNTAGRP